MNEEEIAKLNRRKKQLNKQLKTLHRNMEVARLMLQQRERTYYTVKGRFEAIDRKLAMQDGRHQVVESREIKKKTKSEKEITRGILSLGQEAIQKLIDELEED
jgi:hypothetical protein